MADIEAGNGAFGKGRHSRLTDVPLTACPHLQDTEDYEAWCAG